MWHLKRPFPRGTMRSPATLAGTFRQGTFEIAITGGAGGTLLPGDMVGITTSNGVQLVQVTASANSGTVSCEISPPLRANAINGSTVYLNKPVAHFISLTSEIMIPYGPSSVDPGATIDLVEV